MEQFYQGAKAAQFNDDISHFKIMQEMNPFKIKKLENNVKNFKKEAWRKQEKNIMYRALKAKFTQNETLRNILLVSGDCQIVEGSTDPFWGTGTHIRDKSAMDS